MPIEAESIKPYAHDDRAKGQQVKQMFDNIAPAYDFMNRAMTLGIDRFWRTKAVKMMVKHLQKSRSTDSCSVLDVATGTADLAISIAGKIPSANVTGIDLSDGMVQLGRKKVEEAGLSHRITLEIADCLDLPFADNTFDCVSVAFGVRNFEHLLEGYREMQRVLRPGGLLCVIELSTPTSPLVKPFYRLYTRHIIPIAGRMASKDVSAYSYLPASIEAVPQGKVMTQLIEEAGFTHARCLPLTFGVCSIYTAVAP